MFQSSNHQPNTDRRCVCDSIYSVSSIKTTTFRKCESCYYKNTSDDHCEKRPRESDAMEHLSPAHEVDGDDDDKNVARYHPLTPPPQHLYDHPWMDHRNHLHHHMDNDHNNNNHSYNTHKDQALLLDIYILQTILHRNRSSHGRTLYYRRTKMALQQVHRTLFKSSSSTVTSNHTHTLFHEWNQYYQNQLQQIILPLQKQNKSPPNNDVIQPIIEKLFMEFTLPMSTTATTSTATTNHTNNMLHRILYDITDCIGRIEYAYSAGRMEVVRGFFLSILTIWMASLARIYVLLLQLQYTVIRQYSQYLSQQLRPAIQLIRNIHSSSSSSNSNSISNIPTLLEQVNHLRHDIFQPILSRIHQKLTRYQHSKTIQQQETSSRTRQERTQSSLQSLGLHGATRRRPLNRRTLATNPTLSATTTTDHEVTVPVMTATATTIASTVTTLTRCNNEHHHHDMDTTAAAQKFHPPMPGTKEPTSTDNDAIPDDDDDIGILQYGNGQYDDKSNHTDRTTGTGIDEWSLDQNTKAVQQFKNKSRPKKTPTSRSDQKPGATIHAGRAVMAAAATLSRPPTTKKKRTTGDDFFDQLFRG